MADRTREIAKRYDVRLPETYQQFVTPQDGLFAIPAIAQVVGGEISDHYQGRDGFPELIDWGYYMSNTLKSSTTAPEKRWHSTAQIPPELQSKLTVLAFDQPVISMRLAQVSDIAAKVMTQPFETTADLREVYGNHIDYIMSYAIDHFNQFKQPNTVAVTLLRGGLRFEEHFVVDDDRRLQVDAKRLDFGDKMMFGFSDWKGLEALQGDSAPDSVELVFVDDCGATFGSIQSAVLALRARAIAGEFPRIERVRIYLTVAVQQALVDMFHNFKSLGLDVEVVTGDVAYQLSDRYYLERAAGERRPDGTFFPPHAPFVGDMGYIMERR